MEQDYRIIVQKALDAGILADPGWLERPHEPLPAWVVLDVAVRLLEKLDPPYKSYD